MNDDDLEVGRTGDPITLDHLIEVTESVAEIAAIAFLCDRVHDARRDQEAAIAPNSPATGSQDPKSGIGNIGGPREAQNEPQRPCVHCAAPLHRAPCGYWADSDGSERCWNAFDFLHETRPSRVSEPIEVTPQAPVPEASTDEAHSSEDNPERSEGAAGLFGAGCKRCGVSIQQTGFSVWKDSKGSEFCGPKPSPPLHSPDAPRTKSFSDISSEAAEWQRSQDLPDLTDEEAERLAVAKARAIRSMMNKPWEPPK